MTAPRSSRCDIILRPSFVVLCICICILHVRQSKADAHANAAADVQETTCGSDQYPPPKGDRVPKYVINLDLPPHQRWSKLMKDKKQAALVLLKDIKSITETVFKGKLFAFVDKYLPYLARTLPEPYYSEMKGISQATGIPLGEITLYNIFYEVFTVCTSIVAEGGDGRLYHARNLDFGLFLGWDVQNHTWLTTEALRPLAVHLDFRRNNQTVYKSASFAGYVGILTGLKPKQFTLSLDERFQIDGGFVGILRWLIGDRSGKWSGFLLRDVLEKAAGYDEAVSLLTNTKLLAPAYFIVGGNSSSQGAVITRWRDKADLWLLGSASISQQSTWYLVETNYDHWKEPPFYDDRRTLAVECMDRTGQGNISLAALYNVLSTKPVLNKLTTYTSLMDVSAGHLETWLRDCADCSPW